MDVGTVNVTLGEELSHQRTTGTLIAELVVTHSSHTHTHTHTLLHFNFRSPVSVINVIKIDLQWEVIAGLFIFMLSLFTDGSMRKL